MSRYRILCCGSRDWDDPKLIATILDGLHIHHGPLLIIEGGATGADHYAGQWAKNQDQKHVVFRADWNLHGKAAGAIRNKEMLDEGRPDLVVAFSDDLENSKGTRDMVTKATHAHVQVIVVGRK